MTETKQWDFGPSLIGGHRHVRETAAQLYERSEGTAGAELSGLSHDGPVRCARWRGLTETGWNPAGGGVRWGTGRNSNRTQSEKVRGILPVKTHSSQGERITRRYRRICEFGSSLKSICLLFPSLTRLALCPGSITSLREFTFHKECNVFEWNVITRSENFNHRVASSVCNKCKEKQTKNGPYPVSPSFLYLCGSGHRGGGIQKPGLSDFPVVFPDDEVLASDDPLVAPEGRNTGPRMPFRSPNIDVHSLGPIHLPSVGPWICFVVSLALLLLISLDTT